jgi:hypothetical protein
MAVATGLAIAGLVTTVASTVVGGIQQSRAAQATAEAQSQSNRAQAEAARRNQQVAEENALATEKAGAWEVEKARLKAIRLAGSQKVGYAKAGVLMEGSPLDVMAETAKNEELDILATQYNYDVQAARYRSQGSYYGSAAQRYDQMSSNQNVPDYMTGTLLKAGTSILTTGAGLAKNWGGSSYNYSQYAMLQ